MEVNAPDGQHSYYYSSNFTTDHDEGLCEIPTQELLTFKFYAFGIVGTIVAALGVILNLVTFALLMKHAMRSFTCNVYLAALLIFDSLALVLFTLFYSIEYIYQFTGNNFLHELWFTVLRVVYTLYNIVMTGQNFMTLVPIFERFLAVSHPNRHRVICNTSSTGLVICLTTCFSVVFNVVRYFEVKVVTNERCFNQPFGLYELQPLELRTNRLYYELFLMWVSPILNIYGPLILTFLWVIVIIKNIPHNNINNNKNNNNNSQENKPNVEIGAEVTKVVIVIGILFMFQKILQSIAIVLDMVLNEFYAVQSYWLILNEAGKILMMTCAASKFLIWCIFSRQFRSQITGSASNANHNDINNQKNGQGQLLA